MLMLEYCTPRFSLRMRVVVSIAFLVAVAPVAAQWFVGLANGSAIFDGGEAPAALTALLADLPRSTSAIVFIGGIMIGAWTDWLFRTFEDKRRNAGKGLGAQLTRLGDELARLEFSGARTFGLAKEPRHRAAWRSAGVGPHGEVWHLESRRCRISDSARRRVFGRLLSRDRDAASERALCGGKGQGARRPVEIRAHRPSA